MQLAKTLCFSPERSAVRIPNALRESHATRGLPAPSSPAGTGWARGPAPPSPSTSTRSRAPSQREGPGSPGQPRDSGPLDVFLMCVDGRKCSPTRAFRGFCRARGLRKPQTGVLGEGSLEASLLGLAGFAKHQPCNLVLPTFIRGILTPPVDFRWTSGSARRGVPFL